MENKNLITVIFDDEKPLLQALKILQESNEKIIDVLTPFPVHGLDKALGMKRTSIPLIGFIFGALGGLLGFVFQAWVFTIDYPLVFGGKPFFSVPSFIPVTFECTILFAALSMVAAFLIRSKLKPEKEFDPIDERITDDRFVILVGSADEGGDTRENIKTALAGIQIVGIK
jgi:hypothetical protein